MGTASVVAINMVTHAKLPFDTLRDFQPLTTVMATDTILVVHPSVPAHDMKALVALAKQKPGQLAFGSAGTGSILHLALELLNTAAKTQITHVPYKGAGPAVVDVIAGQVNGMFVDLPVISPYIKAGKVRAIAVCSTKRSQYFPDVPTTAESGFPGVQLSNQYSLLLPKKTPRAIVMKLHEAVAKTMAVPEVRERFTSIGADPLVMSPDEFTDFIRKDIAKWAKVAKAANIKVDE
jgi:tripartite-type tricarboxylate transporter receptor subunit TctC